MIRLHLRKSPLLMLHVAFTPTKEPIQFAGAKAASGWVLAWTDEYQFYSWSPSSGWHALPERNYTSYVAGVTVIPLEDGLLVYPDVLHFGTSTNEVGFWVYGAERWPWWESIPEFDSIHAVGNNRVLLWEERIIAADAFWVFACSKDGIERKALLRSEKMDGMYAARGCENDGLEIVSERGIFVVPPPFHVSDICQQRELSEADEPIDLTAGSGRLFETCAIISDENKLAYRLELENGRLEATGISIESPEVFWRWHLTGDTSTLRDAIFQCASVEARAEEEEVFDILIDEEGGIEAIVSNRGVTYPTSELETAALDSEAFISPWLISWLLCVVPEETQAMAFRHLISGRWGFLSVEPVVEMLAHVFGAEACRSLLEHLADTSDPTDSMLLHDELRDLFGRFGQEVAPVVRQHLEDSSGDALSLAAYVAGASEQEEGMDVRIGRLSKPPSPNRRLLLWRNAEEAPVEALRRCCYGDHPVTTKKAALNSLGCIQPEGMAQALLPLVEHEDEEIRRAAIPSISADEDISDETLDVISGRALYDWHDGVRETAIEALARSGPPSSSVATLTRAFADIAHGKEALEAIEKLEVEVSVEEAFRLIDLLLLRQAGYALESVEDILPIAASDLAEALAPALTKQLGFTADDVDGLYDVSMLEAMLPTPIPAHVPRIVACLSLVAVYLTRFLPTGYEHLGDDSPEQLLEIWRIVVGEEIASIEQLRKLIDGDDKAFEGLAVQIAKKDEPLGARLACIGTFALGAPTGYSSDAVSTTGGYQPLHQRLRTAKPANTSAARCFEITTEIADEDSLLGLFASLALYRHNDKDRMLIIRERILSGMHADYPLAMCFYAADKWKGGDREQLVHDYATSAALPLHLRVPLLLSEQPGRNCYFNVSPPFEATLSPITYEALAREALASDLLLSWKYRRCIAAELFDRIGDAQPLIDLWEEREEEAPLNEDEAYRRAKDFVRAGHTEHLGTVRSCCLEQEDASALGLLHEFGTRVDIALVQQLSATLGIADSDIEEVIADLEQRPSAT